MRKRSRREQGSRSSATLQSIALMVGLTSFIVLSLALADDRSDRNAATSSGGSFLSPSYAVIDLGTNMINPLKITDSGYVLGRNNTQTTGPLSQVSNQPATIYGIYHYYVWSNGSAPLSLLPADPNATSWEATDVGEDGTVVGLESVFRDDNSIPYVADPAQGYIPNLAVWARGQAMPQLTPPPVFLLDPTETLTCEAYMMWTGETMVSNTIQRGQGTPFLSPRAIWSAQVAGSTQQPRYQITLDGFEASRAAGTGGIYSSQAPLGTLAANQGAFSGEAVFPLAANSGDQCLKENDSQITQVPSTPEPAWLPEAITFTVGTTTLPSGFVALGGQGTLSNTNSLGNYSVLGSDGALTPVFSPPTKYECWDGVHMITLPQLNTNQPPGIIPNGLNAMTASITTSTNTPPQTVAATQVIGNAGYETSGYVWNLIASTNATPTFGTPQLLDSLVSGYGTTNAPWSGIAAASINDSGAIVGTATYTPPTLPPGQSPPANQPAAGQHGVMLLPLSFVRETTPGSGDFEPIKDNGLDDQAQLPIFASETGQGMTETDSGGYSMSAVLSTDLSSTSVATVNVSYAINGGGSYSGTLTETAAGSGVFHDSGGTNVLTLTPSSQTTSSSTTLSTLSATITIPSLSVSSQPVSLIEAQPLTFQAATVLTDVALAGALSTTVVNSITVTFHSNFFAADAIALTETGVNTRVFKDSAGDITLTMSGFTGGSTMNISVTGAGLTPSSFGSTLTETSGTSLQYSDFQRSYGTATNYTPATDGQGVFYVQFPGSTATSITLVSGGNSVTTTASPVSGQPNLLRTGKLVLLEPSDTFSASGYTTLTVSPPTGGGTPTVQLQMYGQTIVDPGTVHDAYLGFGLGEGDGSVHLGQIKNILAANASSPSTPNLGWTVPTVHGVSVKSDVLNEIGKHSLWYIFTHGLTADGENPPLVSFRLYNSSNPTDHTQAQLLPGDVSANIGTDTYELVFFNGCFSADPSSGSAAPAFASNFKADVYVGWSTAEFDIFAFNAGKIFFTTLEQHNSIQNALNAVNNTRAFKTTAQLRVIGDPTVISKTIIDKSPIPPQ